MEEVYHQGEKAVQRLVGEEQSAQTSGKVITDTIIKGAVNFIEKQPMAVVSSVDEQKRIWTSLLVGDFGFVRASSPTSLFFEESMVRSDKGDVFYQNIQENAVIGSLFIELTTRRRFRINGVSSCQNARIEVQVQEAYPNCPKYIQRRVISLPHSFKETISVTTRGVPLSPIQQEWIKGADTLFVGSQGKNGRVDASHRGGPVGFVEVIDNHTLKIPDYHGNSMYNTLGNVVQNPRAGLLFIDFEKGRTLQLTGRVELLFEQQSEEDIQKTTGTGRYWIFVTEQWICTENHHQVDWEFLDYSPFNP